MPESPHRYEEREAEEERREEERRSKRHGSVKLPPRSAAKILSDAREMCEEHCPDEPDLSHCMLGALAAQIEILERMP